MPSRIAVIAIDAVHPRLIAHFWCNVLGWHVVEEDDGGVSIASPDGAWPTIDVFGVAEGKAVKNRLHLDLYPTGRDDALPLDRRIEIVEAKVAELVGLGASVERRTRHDDPEDPIYYAVMHDPEGNEFCVS